MNKTVTINISGLIFNIDEEAYSKLQKYLATIESYFKNAEGGNEIMTDIEGRIAEMFSERISDRKEVVSMTDVDAMIATMGQPEDFVDEETKEENARNSEKENTTSEEETESQETRETQYNNYDRGSRRFYRDPDGRIVGGVCSGIGYYFGIDPVIIRLLFVIAVVLGFSGIIVYILFWIITPKAITRAEKLQMKGRKVNIENIKQTVKDEANEVKKNFKNFEGQVEQYVQTDTGRRIENFFHSFFSFIGNILVNVIRFLGKFLGLILILVSGFFLFFLSLSIVGIASWDGPFMFGSNGFSLSGAEVSNLIFTNDWAGYFFSFGSALFFGIPLVFLLIVGFKILVGIKSNNRYLGWGLGGLWFLGIILLVIGSSSIARDFTKVERSTRTVALPPTFADTVNVSVNLDQIPLNAFPTSPDDFLNLMKIDDKAMYFSNVKLNVTESQSDSILVSVEQKSRAGSIKEALINAEKIGYSYSIDGNEIIFDPYFTIPITDQYRYQEVFLNISIPIGKTVYLGNDCEWIIYDIKNVSNTYDRNMAGNYWTMTENGLQCLHCNFECYKCPSSNSTQDLNSMSVRELKTKLYETANRIELERLEFEKRMNKKRVLFEKQIIRMEKKIKNTSNETKLLEYKLKLEELESNMKIELKKAQLEFDSQLRDFEVMMQEIEETIERNYPEEKEEKKTSHWDEGESDASTSSVLTRLSFPSPFRILS